MNWKAAKTSAWLSLLFLAVYGSCNWFTAQRSNVPSFYFDWERHIPFAPLMIIPYMSIDLFFIAAPFFCRDERQRRTLARRITAAILIAGVCFLLFPLRFAFERPHVDGWLGVIFNSFRELDQPFNQFPSLHIALRTILAVLYVHHTRGLLRIATRVWFSFIGFSTVLTYQHHIIDVIGGFALAALCLYLFQDQPLRQPVVRNLRIGIYYIVAAIAMTALALVAPPWTFLLFWPGASLAVVASAYFGLGSGIFRKTNGRLPLISWLVLWPVLLGQRLSLFYYARQCRPYDRLTERLWIGRRLSDAEARQVIAEGVTAVLDLTGEFSESHPFLGLAYRNLPILDLTAPTPEQIDQAIAFIHEHSAGGIVYVHCKIGYSRTAAVAGVYLLASGAASSVEQALSQVRAVRPSIIIRPEAVDAIRRYHANVTANASAVLSTVTE